MLAASSTSALWSWPSCWFDYIYTHPTVVGLATATVFRQVRVEIFLSTLAMGQSFVKRLETGREREWGQWIGVGDGVSVVVGQQWQLQLVAWLCYCTVLLLACELNQVLALATREGEFVACLVGQGPEFEIIVCCQLNWNFIFVCVLLLTWPPG